MQLRATAAESVLADRRQPYRRPGFRQPPGEAANFWDERQGLVDDGSYRGVVAAEPDPGRARGASRLVHGVTADRVVPKTGSDPIKEERERPRIRFRSRVLVPLRVDRVPDHSHRVVVVAQAGRQRGCRDRHQVGPSGKPLDQIQVTLDSPIGPGPRLGSQQVVVNFVDHRPPTQDRRIALDGREQVPDDAIPEGRPVTGSLRMLLQRRIVRGCKVATVASKDRAVAAPEDEHVCPLDRRQV